MGTDLQGLDVTANSASVAGLNTAVDELYAWRGDPVATLMDATTAEPGFSLGYSATASMLKR